MQISNDVLFVLTIVFMFDLSLWNSETFIEKSYNNRFKNICFKRSGLWKTDLNGASYYWSLCYYIFQSEIWSKVFSITSDGSRFTEED